MSSVFFTDELLTKLAQQNQLQQQEIEELKRQVKEQNRRSEEAKRQRLNEEQGLDDTTVNPRHKPRRVIDMSNPQVAQSRVVGRIDESTGRFIRTASSLRGRETEQAKDLVERDEI